MASTEMEQTEGYKNEERKKGLQVDLRNRGTERERERERASLTLITRSTKKLVLLGPFFWRFLKQIKHKENKWVQVSEQRK